jgi:hypothetical protein
LDDYAFDKISVIKFFDCSLDGGEKISRGSDVVNCDTQGAP